MEDCRFLILVENTHGYISQCSCCQEFSFCYKNILLKLNEPNLIIFCEWLIENAYNPNFIVELPGQRTRVYRSPVDNLYLTFQEHELREISDLFTEAKLLMEVRRILS